MARLDRILSAMGTLGASDVILSPNQHPIQIVNGQPQEISNFPVLSADELETHLYELVNESQRKYFINHGDLCFPYELSGSGRYRCTFSRALEGISAQVRYVPEKVRPLAKLGVSEQTQEVLSAQVNKSGGLYLLAGPISSGKSMTAATLLHTLAHTSTSHIVCLEKPTEFIHKDSTSIVTHRDLTQLDLEKPVTISEAYDAALRADVDAVYFADLTDKEQVRAVIEAASSGKWVLATVAAKSFDGALTQIEKHFKASELPFIREVLATHLEAIFLQELQLDTGEPAILAPVIGAALMNEAGKKPFTTEASRIGKKSTSRHWKQVV